MRSISALCLDVIIEDSYHHHSLSICFFHWNRGRQFLFYLFSLTYESLWFLSIAVFLKQLKQFYVTISFIGVNFFYRCKFFISNFAPSISVELTFLSVLSSHFQCCSLFFFSVSSSLVRWDPNSSFWNEASPVCWWGRQAAPGFSLSA